MTRGWTRIAIKSSVMLSKILIFTKAVLGLVADMGVELGLVAFEWDRDRVVIEGCDDRADVGEVTELAEVRPCPLPK